MQDLHLVGYTTDRRHLIFSTRRGAKSGSFLVPVDETLLAAIDDLADAAAAVEDEQEEAVEPAPVVNRVDAQLSVREVQARLRAGDDVAEIAADAGVDPEWVERFAAPIRAEQRQIVERALRMRMERPRSGTSSVPLRRAVAAAMAERGVPFTAERFDAAWTSRLVGADRWTVEFTFVHRGRSRTVSWTVDAAAGTLTTTDRTASQLGFVSEDVEVPPESETIGGPATTGATAASAGASARPGDAGAPAKNPSARKRPTRRRAASEEAAAKKAAAKKAAAAKKKAAARKAAAKKAAAKKAAAKKAAARKAAARKAAAKKAAAKKAAAKKAAAKKKAPAAKKRTTRKASAERKSPAGEKPTTEKASAKKRPAKKVAAKKAAAKRSTAKRAPVRKTASEERPVEPKRRGGRASGSSAPPANTAAPRKASPRKKSSPPRKAVGSRRGAGEGEPEERRDRTQAVDVPPESSVRGHVPDDVPAGGRPHTMEASPARPAPLTARPADAEGRRPSVAPGPSVDGADARRSRSTVQFRSGAASPAGAADDGASDGQVARSAPAPRLDDGRDGRSERVERHPRRTRQLRAR